MRRAILLLALLGAGPCEQKLSPTELAAKNRSECMVIATSESGFDPLMAEEPPRTISSSHKRGGDLKEGAVDVGKGALGGAVLGVAGGAVAGEAGKGAAAGAVVGGLIGGARHYKKRQEVVTTSRPNPAYQEYAAMKDHYRSALEQCLASRAEAKP
jgi:hypothetical protein